jgi:hypothetical protein
MRPLGGPHPYVQENPRTFARIRRGGAVPLHRERYTKVPNRAFCHCVTLDIAQELTTMETTEASGRCQTPEETL